VGIGEYHGDHQITQQHYELERGRLQNSTKSYLFHYYNRDIGMSIWNSNIERTVQKEKAAKAGRHERN